MGSVRGPYVIVWAGIGPNRKRVMIRMCLGGSGRIFGFPIFGGSDRKLVFRFSIFFGGDDGAQGGRGWDRTYPRVTVFHIWTHTDTYWALWGPMGPMGPIFNFSDFCPLGPPRIFRKVSVVMPEEQSLPITQKRHGQMALCKLKDLV